MKRITIIADDDIAKTIMALVIDCGAEVHLEPVATQPSKRRRKPTAQRTLEAVLRAGSGDFGHAPFTYHDVGRELGKLGYAVSSGSSVLSDAVKLKLAIKDDGVAVLSNLGREKLSELPLPSEPGASARPVAGGSSS